MTLGVSGLRGDRLLVAVSVVSALLALSGLPLVGGLVGLVLLLGLQGLGAVRALLPRERDGTVIEMAVVLGLVLTALEGLLLHLLRIDLSRTSVVLAAGLASTALAVGAATRSRPVESGTGTSGTGIRTAPSTARSTTTRYAVCAAAMVVVAVLLGNGLPVAVRGDFSTVSLAGASGPPSGVVVLRTGEVFPLAVEVTNHEQSQRVYRVRVLQDGRSAVEAEPVVVGRGARGRVSLGVFSAPADGCLSQLSVVAESGRNAYRLTVWLRAAGKTCGGT